jgi:hypothetical protein
MIAHSRHPRLSKLRLHRSRESLIARLASPPHRVASVRLLRHRFVDEAAHMRQPAVASTRTSRLDRRRVEANDAHASVHAWTCSLCPLTLPHISLRPCKSLGESSTSERPGHIPGVPSRPKHLAQPLALDVGSPRAALVTGNSINSSHITRSPHPNGPACSHDPCTSKTISARLPPARFANGRWPVPLRDAGLRGRRDRRWPGFVARGGI